VNRRKFVGWRRLSEGHSASVDRVDEIRTINSITLPQVFDFDLEPGRNFFSNIKVFVQGPCEIVYRASPNFRAGRRLNLIPCAKFDSHRERFCAIFCEFAANWTIRSRSYTRGMKCVPSGNRIWILRF